MYMKSQQFRLLVILLAFNIITNTVKAKEDQPVKGANVFSEKELEEKQIIIEAANLLNANPNEEAYQALHNVLQRVETTYGKTSTKLLLANYFTRRSLWDSSNYYIEEGIKLGESIVQDSLKTRMYAMAYRQYGLNYSNMGDYGEAKKWYIKALDESSKFSDPWLYYALKHQLGLIYSKTEDYDNALKEFSECLNFEGGGEIVYGSYINIGDIYGFKDDYDSSNYYLLKAKLMCDEVEDLYCQSVISTSLAYNYHYQKNYKKALEYYEKTVEIAEIIDDVQLLAVAKNGIGCILTEFKQFTEAKKELSEALLLAIKHGYLYEQRAVYKSLKELAVDEHKFKEALQMADKYTLINDSLTKLQRIEEISRLEVEYETRQKEKEIELLRKDKQLQTLEIDRQKSIRNITLISFVILISILVALAFQYYKRLKAQKMIHQKQKVINQKNITALMKEHELRLMEASIEGKEKERERIAQELHDSIGSNLAAIKLMLNNHPVDKELMIKSAKSQLDETYQQLRDLSHSLIPKRFGDNDFCEILNEYLNEIGNAGKLTTSFLAYPKELINEVDEKIKIETFKIIQELITNVIKHSEATQIELQLNLIDDVFNIILEDNGVGFNPDIQATGIGLNNIHSRLENLSGNIEIDSMLKRGTIINIEIPMALQFVA